MLRAKGAPLAIYLLDMLGTDDTSHFLSMLIETYRGSSFTYEDLMSVMNSSNIEISDVLEDWLYSVGVPGFITGDVENAVVKTDDGRELYDVSFVIHNNETVDGYTQISWSSDNMDIMDRASTRSLAPSFSIGSKKSVKVTIRSRGQISNIFVELYFSLNRGEIMLHVPWPTQQETDEIPSPQFVKEIHWQPSTNHYIVVDDLDDGFEIVSTNLLHRKTVSFKKLKQVLGFRVYDDRIQGLPIFDPVAEEHPRKRRWVRRIYSGAYGKYQHTFAFLFDDETRRSSYAKFAVRLPHNGPWRLEYHLPIGSEEYVKLSEFDPGIFKFEQLGVSDRFKPKNLFLEVRFSKKNILETFDATRAEYGWHPIGIYEVDSVETEVWISSKSDGSTVYADAIRWIPFVDTKAE